MWNAALASDVKPSLDLSFAGAALEITRMQYVVWPTEGDRASNHSGKRWRAAFVWEVFSFFSHHLCWGHITYHYRHMDITFILFTKKILIFSNPNPLSFSSKYCFHIFVMVYSRLKGHLLLLLCYFHQPSKIYAMHFFVWSRNAKRKEGHPKGARVHIIFLHSVLGLCPE